MQTRAHMNCREPQILVDRSCYQGGFALELEAIPIPGGLDG
jgi:hypothetical protein